MKVVDRDNISTEIIVPSEIRHKCLIINRGQDDSDICIPCNIRFEKDWQEFVLHVCIASCSVQNIMSSCQSV